VFNEADENFPIIMFALAYKDLFVSLCQHHQSSCLNLMYYVLRGLALSAAAVLVDNQQECFIMKKHAITHSAVFTFGIF